MVFTLYKVNFAFAGYVLNLFSYLGRVSNYSEYVLQILNKI